MTRFTRLIFIDICDVMFSFLKLFVGGVTGICRAHAHQGKPNQQNQPIWFSCWINSCFLRASMKSGPLQNHLKLLAAGLKTYEVPPDYSGNQSFSVCYVINNSVMCLKCNIIFAVFYKHRSGRNSIFELLF